MIRFYVGQLTVNGEKVKTSEIIFQDGVNIIHGPSNTGKSYIIGCLDFMFDGDDAPFSKNATGYDTVTMTLKSDGGYTIVATRKIVDGEKGEKAATKINVVSDFPEVESGEYNTDEYSDMLLKLFGVQEHHKIIATQDRKANNLRIRTIFHLFFRDEDHIFNKKTPFDTPKFNKITASLMGLLFLITGKDYNAELLPNETKEERERRAAQKSGVIIYLNKKMKSLSERKAKMEKTLAQMDGIDVDMKIDEIVSEIEKVNMQISEATQKSRELLKQIYSISGSLEEAKFLRDRYHSLQTQYAADIKRLQFIVEGEQNGTGRKKVLHCPFCDSVMQEKQPQKKSYVDAASAELAKVMLQIKELRIAEDDLDKEIAAQEQHIKVLNAQNNSVIQLSNQTLKPRADELKVIIDTYRKLIQIRQEVYALDVMSGELNTDVQSEEYQSEEAVQQFDAKAFFDKDNWEAISKMYEDAVRKCAYPGNPVGRLSIETCDAVVDGKFKKDEGKGYRAFLNTITVFVLMKYMEKNAKHAPRMLFLDSPVLSLKEKKHKFSQRERATPGMKESLFKYIIQNCGKNQVIIAENELPDNVDYTGVNLIEFTQDEHEGRYGFLESERALEEA